jgi:hypothetical protein
MVGLIESKYMKENEIDEEEKFMYNSPYNNIDSSIYKIKCCNLRAKIQNKI